MRFSSAISTETDLATACEQATRLARHGLDTARPNLCVAFFSPSYAGIESIGTLLHELTSATCVFGCSGGGIAGGGHEVEDRPALSITLASLPDADIATRFVTNGDLPSPDAPPPAWVDLVGADPASTRAIITLPEPFSMAADQLLAGLDFAYPNAPKIGGLASGCHAPLGHALVVGRHVARQGAALLAIGGDSVRVLPRVAQGCKPFGKPGRITKARGHQLRTIDSVPATHFLQSQIHELHGSDLELARSAPLFLGIESDPFAIQPPGAGDFLIRNVLAVDAENGSLRIGADLPIGRTVRFHLRDAQTSSEDLDQVLGRDATGARVEGSRVQGALMFACLGRGRQLYGEPDHDTKRFAARFPDVPLGGFFCNGEIGPVPITPAETHVHGYTSAFALFAKPDPLAP